MMLPPLINAGREIDGFIASGALGWARFDEPTQPQYRHILGRRVSAGNSVVVWGMLNPSIAGAVKNDPTVTRVIGFTRDMGKAIALVVNVSDYIATQSTDLVDVGAPVSTLWAPFIMAAVKRADIVICGWGANGRKLPARVDAFLHVVRTHFAGPLHCLRITEKTRQPEHPLMLPAALRPVVYLNA